MTVNTYDFGEVVRIAGTMTASGANVDPDVVTLSIFPERAGDPPVVLTYPTGIVRAATGEYYYDYQSDTAGRVFYAWASEDPVLVDNDFFLVLWNPLA